MYASPNHKASGAVQIHLLATEIAEARVVRRFAERFEVAVSHHTQTYGAFDDADPFERTFHRSPLSTPSAKHHTRFLAAVGKLTDAVAASLRRNAKSPARTNPPLPELARVILHLLESVVPPPPKPRATFLNPNNNRALPPSIFREFAVQIVEEFLVSAFATPSGLPLARVLLHRAADISDLANLLVAVLTRSAGNHAITLAVLKALQSAQHSTTSADLHILLLGGISAEPSRDGHAVVKLCSNVLQREHWDRLWGHALSDVPQCRRVLAALPKGPVSARALQALADHRTRKLPDDLAGDVAKAVLPNLHLDGFGDFPSVVVREWFLSFACSVTRCSAYAGSFRPL